MNTDGGGRTSISPEVAITTAATTGPKILGVAPTEIVVPTSDVWISGLNLTTSGPVSVKLVDSVTGQVRPVSVLGVEPNRIRVSIERPSDLNGRRRYFLQVNANHKSDVAADIVHLSSAGTFLPPGQSIRVQFIRWGWIYFCDPYYPCKCLPLHGGSPGGVDLVNDTWSHPYWSRFLTHVNDTSREWGAMCSEARGSAYRVKGLVEANQRVSLKDQSMYQLEIATHSEQIRQLANRVIYGGNGSVWDYCGPNALGGVTQPSDCYNWLPNGNGRINVHLVGKFLFFGDEVDPAEAESGIADPANIYTTNTRGMVILTDNPFLNARPMPQWLTWFCPDHYGFQNPASSLNTTYWWGGSYGKPKERATEPTPNLLSHELHHVLTSYVHGAPGTDPCFTPSVGFPSTSCPRGFNMDLGANTTTSFECSKVVNGFQGRDYTQ